MSRSIFKALVAVVCASLLAGCFFKPDTSGPTSSDSYDGPHRTRPMEREAAPVAQPVAQPVATPAAVTRPDEYIVYFDFDQSRVRSEYTDLLDRHAAYLKANPGTKLVLEGHCDERGTREYNIALGERRAKAVRSYLTARGVDASALEIVSFGEEKPAESASNEAAWAKNRRAELRYE